jgi:hypothetical protein
VHFKLPCPRSAGESITGQCPSTKKKFIEVKIIILYKVMNNLAVLLYIADSCAWRINNFILK